MLLCVSAEAQPLSNASPAGKVKVEDLSPLETEPRPQARPTAPVTVETQGTTLKNKETIFIILMILQRFLITKIIVKLKML